jgi:radical SAM-linked protein
MHIAATKETMLLVIKFKISGTIRFLSHAEMLRVFQRACVRAGIGVLYSHGFNPRPKISLPLPRPVGVESDNELLCIRTTLDPDLLQASNNESRIKTELSAQLPEGCELISVNTTQTGTSFQPRSATYVFTVLPEHLNEGLSTRIDRLTASESLNIRRQIKEKSGFKNINVRKFLKSIKLDNRDIIVECNISSAGSIRTEEILRLLELDEAKLASPIRRTNVQWQTDEL